MCLLIVEDDVEVRSALARVSEQYFNKVHVATSAVDALVHIKRDQPSVIVSDWDLNEALSGVDIANFAKQNSPHSRIVLITGKPMPNLKSRTTHLDIDHYIAKPFSVNDIRSVFVAMS